MLKFQGKTDLRAAVVADRRAAAVSLTRSQRFRLAGSFVRTVTGRFTYKTTQR